MANIRRRGRVTALKALYEIDVARHEPEATLAHLLADRELPSEAAQFAAELVRGVLQHQQDIDATIGHYAPAWPLEQISPVDRNILRLAIFEILHHNMAPMKVAINEAVELAKAFGSESSSRFVNGVLGSVSSLAIKE